MYVCVCMRVCTYVSAHVCYVCMYVCMEKRVSLGFIVLYTLDQLLRTFVFFCTTLVWLPIKLTYIPPDSFIPLWRNFHDDGVWERVRENSRQCANVLLCFVLFCFYTHHMIPGIIRPLCFPSCAHACIHGYGQRDLLVCSVFLRMMLTRVSVVFSCLRVFMHACVARTGAGARTSYQSRRKGRPWRPSCRCLRGRAWPRPAETMLCFRYDTYSSMHIKLWERRRN